ncbi:MAG: glutathionylspermidine synthase family protein [Candidatus Saccharimonas sp.]
MRRVELAARKKWQKRCADAGFTFYDLPSENGDPYWRETAAYELTLHDVETIETATNELFMRCMDAVEHVVANRRFAEFGIPEQFWAEIIRSWNDDDPTVYGRFDFVYDGKMPPKLFEFNADTPTSLLEASIVQWWWMREVKGKQADQFNSIHEALVEQWRHIREKRLAGETKDQLVLASLHSGAEGEFLAEDYDLVQYMTTVAEEAGFKTRQIFIEQIAWDDTKKQFVDANNLPITTIFKLYPWEWMVHEDYGPKLLEASAHTRWIEPIWKMLLSNKQLLVVLWELFPGHPNLLETYTQPNKLRGRSYVKKPKLSREGANVTIFSASGNVIESVGGDYGEEGYVYQAYQELPVFYKWRPVIGSWVVGQDAVGVGIRETSTHITGDMAFFVPHYIANP